LHDMTAAAKHALRVAEELADEGAAAAPVAQDVRNDRLMSTICPPHGESDAEERTANFAG
jgi:hypothetical protein